MQGFEEQSGPLLTVKQVAERLGVSAASIYIGCARMGFFRTSGYSTPSASRLPELETFISKQRPDPGQTSFASAEFWRKTTGGGLVDNVAKPLLVKRGLDLHGAVVFVAPLGGWPCSAAGLLLGS